MKVFFYRRCTPFINKIIKKLHCDRRRAFQGVTSQVPQPTCFWKWVGRTNPQKSGILTLEVCFSAKKKYYSKKAQRNWGESCMSLKFCHLKTFLKNSLGLCDPLTPTLRFGHLSGGNWPSWISWFLLPVFVKITFLICGPAIPPVTLTKVCSL